MQPRYSLMPNNSNDSAVVPGALSMTSLDSLYRLTL